MACCYQHFGLGRKPSVLKYQGDLQLCRVVFHRVKAAAGGSRRGELGGIGGMRHSTKGEKSRSASRSGGCWRYRPAWQLAAGNSQWLAVATYMPASLWQLAASCMLAWQPAASSNRVWPLR
jgi:hypothetical protein